MLCPVFEAMENCYMFVRLIESQFKSWYSQGITDKAATFRNTDNYYKQMIKTI